MLLAAAPVPAQVMVHLSKLGAILPSRDPAVMGCIKRITPEARERHRSDDRLDAW
jgi:hypothetical protein